MKTWLTVLAIILILFVAYLAYAYFVDNEPAELVQECPDEMIINKMPGTQQQSAYFIKDGKRSELNEYDQQWVAANCNVKIQEVY